MIKYDKYNNYYNSDNHKNFISNLIKYENFINIDKYKIFILNLIMRISW